MSVVGTLGGGAASAYRVQSSSGAEARGPAAEAAGATTPLAHSSSASPAVAPAAGLLSPHVVGSFVGLQAGSPPTAVTAGGRTGAQLGLPTVSLASDLTAGDLQFISAATGVDPSKRRAASRPVTGAAEAMAAQIAAQIAGQIAGQRNTGVLQGAFTAGDFNKLAAQLAEIGQPLDPRIVSAGTQYLQTLAGAAGATPTQSGAAAST